MKTTEDAVKELIAQVKAVGNQKAVQVIELTGMTVEQIRCGPVEVIRARFNEAIHEDLIPAFAKYNWFKSGWRGAAQLFNHGSATAYTQGCRCNDCREGWRRYNMDKRNERKGIIMSEIADKAKATTDKAAAAQRRIADARILTEWRLSVEVQGADSGYENYEGARLIYGKETKTRR